jgi:hypothetical protein
MTALAVRTAASGLTRGAAGDKVKPTTPTQMIPLAIRVASATRGRRWASDIYRKLQRGSPGVLDQEGILLFWFSARLQTFEYLPRWGFAGSDVLKCTHVQI